MAQNLDSVQSHVTDFLSNHYKKYPQEKVFIHTDEDVYAGGQTVWYKAYTTAYGKPSKLSGVIYVQLADSAGNVVVQNKLKLNDGAAHGNIDLPDSLRSGWYQLVGFTAWMMNFDKTEFFRKKIYVQNLRGTVSVAKENTQKAKYHIQFFPEGGDPVEGSLCNVAFKATDDAGLPVKADGEILNADKKAVAKIVTVHDGMGLFSIEGYAGKKNTAVVRFPDQSVQTVVLPGFKQTGVSFQVNNMPPDAVELKIAFNGSLPQYRNMLLAAYQDNGIIQTYPLQLANGINVFDIKKAEFSTGILRLTLFNQDDVPQAERIVFVDKNDLLKLSLSADTLSFLPRSQSVFSLGLNGTDGKPAAGRFSVAITDADVAANSDDDNIDSWLLMSSELKGKVFSPAYYFKDNSDTLKQQLDLVMMTSGWRHFKWDRDTVKLKFAVERSQYLAGKIAGYNEKVFASQRLKVKMMIQNQDSSKYFGYVSPDTTGSFILDNYAYSGRSDVFMETVDPKNRVKKLKINLFNTLADSLRTVCFLPLDSNRAVSKPVTDQFISNGLKDREARLNVKGILLKTVDIKEKKLTPVEEIVKDHVSALFDAGNAYDFDMADNPSAASFKVFDYLRGRVPGLQIIDSLPDYYIFLYHGPSTLKGKSDPYVYLDEAMIPVDEVSTIPMTDIALIRFIPPPVSFAPLNGGNIGAIMIYTKNYKDDRRNLPSYHTFDRYTFNGYTITREFAAPDYNDPKVASATDARNTLYWNHDVNMDGKGKIKIRFTNSDKTKRYRIIIQGMDAEGRLGYLNEEF